MGERGREEGSESSGGDETDGMNVKNNLDLSVCVDCGEEAGDGLGLWAGKWREWDHHSNMKLHTYWN